MRLAGVWRMLDRRLPGCLHARRMTCIESRALIGAWGFLLEIRARLRDGTLAGRSRPRLRRHLIGSRQAMLSYRLGGFVRGRRAVRWRRLVRALRLVCLRIGI